ncbi:MAG: translocation/assembly module TamB, partial [Muribaculaceae bacterium]|nr:translocation/assembly module TamB [Muribaculaceae bacterium]
MHTVLMADNVLASIDASADLILDGRDSRILLNADIDSFNPSLMGWLPKYNNYILEGKIRGDLSGNNIDNMVGEVEVDDFRFSRPESQELQFNRLTLAAAGEPGSRSLSLRNDWLDFDIEGDYRFASLPNEMQTILHSIFPSLIDIPKKKVDFSSTADFSLLIHPDNSLTEFFRLPVRLLVPVTLGGSIDGVSNTASLALDVPYLQQGKNKLLRDNRLVARLDGADRSFSMELASTFPAKKGDMSVSAYFWGQDENIHTDISWITPENTDFKGRVSFDATLLKNPFSRVPEIDVEIKPSIFDVGTARWNIADSRLSYKEKALTVDGLRISHDGQFVEIDGVASANPDDSLSVKLAGIDLGYIFDTLNINYVTFGGVATGDITARNVFTPLPEALTDNLTVEGLSYNGALLGDGLIRSRWLNNEKEVEIKADITDHGRKRAVVDGGIWVTRDSLSFAIDADRVPVDFLSPFMSAFSSDVKGFASGNAKLFGSFSDIDLVGSLYADSLSMKLDYTNTYYHGSDSVYLHPGKIEIPSFRLYDRDGNSALLSGTLTHRYFHDPSFNFRLTDARHLLCYDTNAKMNPDWYGTVYGNGSAIVRGWPGVVSVTVDMSLVGNSAFTFVLNETEAAQDYHFLTFTDRRKEESEKSKVDSVPDVLAMFRKKMDSNVGPPSNFMLDLRASVTPSSLFTLVMDPVAGDKITARGNGAMQMTYDTESDQLKMLGKYTLEEGNYNFSLQDLILKDFTIRQGSSIAFNGDPMNAML